MFYLYWSSIIGDPASNNIGLCELCPSTSIDISASTHVLSGPHICGDSIDISVSAHVLSGPHICGDSIDISVSALVLSPGGNGLIPHIHTDILWDEHFNKNPDSKNNE